MSVPPTFVDLVAVGAAYLLGSISFSYWTVRRQLGTDVRTLGSGNAGATNVLRVAGGAPAAFVLLGDLGKGVLAVVAAHHWGVGDRGLALVAAAVVLGHVFPVFHGFRGGKGVATAAGAVGSLMPSAALGGVLVFGLVVLATRHVALGSMAGVGSCPVLALVLATRGWMPAPSAWTLGATTGIALLIIWLHRSNIRRIRAGTEWRLGDPR